MTAVAPRAPRRARLRPPSPTAAAVLALALASIVLAALDVGSGPVGLAFLLAGPGYAVHRLLPRGGGADAAIAVTVAASVALLMLLASALLWLGLWSPRTGTLLLALATSVALLLDARSGSPTAAWRRLLALARGEPRSVRALASRLASLRGVGRTRPRSVPALASRLASLRGVGRTRPRSVPALASRSAHPRRASVAVSLLLVADGAWLAALLTIDPAQPEVGGLLVGAPALAVALGLALLGFLAAVRARSWPGALAGLVVVALVLRGTTAIVSGEPMFDWAFKHVGVADFILAQGRLVSSADIYNNWPGLFAASAWIADVTGISPLTQARWVTLALTAGLCLAVSALARRVVSPSRWVGLIAAFLALLFNWVGQDYFAPQGVGLVLALVVLGLVLAPDARSAAVAVLVFAAVVISHQLTPFWVVAVAWALLLRRRVRWWIPVACTLLLGGYVGLHFDVIESYGVFSGTDIVANAQTSGGEFASQAKRIDSLAARLATATLWLAAALVLAPRVWERLRGRPAGGGSAGYAGAVLAFLPFGLLGVQSYGGESILRVALFSLAGCAVVLAPVLDRALTPRGRALGAGERAVAAARGGGPRAGALRGVTGRVGAARAAFAAALVLATGAAAAQAYFGPWYVSQVSGAELRVARTLLADVPPPAYIAPALPAWPDRPTGDYIRWLDRAAGDYDASVFDGLLAGSDFRDPADVAQLERFLGSRRPWPTFVIFSPRMEALNDYRGFYAPGAVDRLRTTLPTRRGWNVVLVDEDIAVLRYVPPWASEVPAARWRAK